MKTDQWGLVPVAQLDSYKGLYFATFDPSAPPLLDYLGSMTWYLDAFFDRREGGIEVLGGVHKWVVPCNWKFPAENFGGDAYHVGWTHLSAIRSGFSTGVTAKPTSGGAMISPGNGHCIISVGPNDSADPPVPEILAYEESIRPEVDRRLGPRYEQVNPIVGTAFPNFSFLRGTSRAMRVWHPRGPGSIEVWSWAFVDKAAPPEIKEQFRLSAIHGFSPSGHLRAGRHGQLAGMHPNLPGCGVPPVGPEHANGAGTRPVRPVFGRNGQRFPVQRIQPPGILSTLGRVDERERLVSLGIPSRIAVPVVTRGTPA